MNTRQLFVSLGLVAALPSAAMAGSFDLQLHDGSPAHENYFNTPTRGQTNQPVGKISFSVASCCGIISSLQVTLAGTRTGLSNFQMWESTDSTFGGDSTFGSLVAADPGAGTLTFSGSVGIPSGNRWFFLTADVASNATGTVLPAITAITANSPVFYFVGNNPMANASEPLPVTLTRLELE